MAADRQRCARRHSAGTGPRRSQPGATQGGGGGRTPTASGPSAVETVGAIVERASRDFGPIGADITEATGGGDGLVSGDRAVGDGDGDSSPQEGARDVGDAIEDAGERGGDAVDDVSDAIWGGDSRGKGKD